LPPYRPFPQATVIALPRLSPPQVRLELGLERVLVLALELGLELERVLVLALELGQALAPEPRSQPPLGHQAMPPP